LLSLLVLLLLAWVLIQTSFFQNWIIGKVTKRLSKELNTTVQIKHVDFSLFNKMLLEGTLVKDHNKDSLLYAGAVEVNINNWFFLGEDVNLKYIGLKDASIFLHRTDSVWNYQFLVDYFSPAEPDTSTRKSSIVLNLEKIDLKNLHILKKDEWRGEDMGFSLQSFALNTKKFDLKKKKIVVDNIDINEPVFSIYNYDGRRPPRIKKPGDTVTVSHKVNPDSLQWNEAGWDIAVNKLTIAKGTFRNDLYTKRDPYPYFDGAHILFGQVNSTIKNIHFRKDTLSCQLALSTKERSGFQVTSMKADVKFHPRAMEFHNLDIHTPKSRLRNFYAMRYDDFDDMSDYISKIVMDGHFKDSEINSDDIAYFAPELKDWKKQVYFTGNVKGTVENMSGKNLEVKAGKTTYLNGDFSMKGLPDIEQTYISFKANELRTTYADASTIFPEIKGIDEPKLSSVQNLRFRGSFNGYIRDFVTAGTIETNLGSLTTDIHMKLPEKGLAIYSGKLTTSNFDLGAFLDNKQFGKASFDGSGKGTAFTFRQLEASLIGKLSSFEFNNYAYKNITVDGKVAKRLFNGLLSIHDENIDGNLDGLVDFSGAKPRFDFTSTVEHSNLQKLNFTQKDIDFNGHFRFNFEGDDIDNFLGSARVYDASIFKEGQRISFDSLTLYSSVVDSNKTLVLMSNEMDAAIAGQFNIKNLPDAFQTFLNRYYPSYIRPSAKILEQEKFSFVITTRNIEDYVAVFTNKVGGFNNSTVSGRINSRDNVFEVTSDVPKFSYGKVAFSGVKMTAKGNRDSLYLTTNIGDTYVNDSLHFPKSVINIVSANDLSAVKIATTANQTLNNAQINADVQTLTDGVRISFKPSSFDINGKKWIVDNNGELILSQDLVMTDGFRIYSDDQEIYLTASPGDSTSANTLNVSLTKINIGDFAPFFVKEVKLDGLLTGDVNITSPFGKMKVDVNAKAEQFRLDNDSIGILNLTAAYDEDKQAAPFSVVSDNPSYQFDLQGMFNVIDSTTDNLNIVTNLKNASIHPLEKYLEGIASHLTGKATGQLTITGSPKKLKYLGKVALSDGGMLIDYTKCYYKIPKANVNFEDGVINFGSFTIKDTLGNTGEVVDSKLYHQNFDNLAFDFKVRSNHLLVLNTKAPDNKQFYGTVIGKVNLTLTGPMDEMEMSIKGEPTDSSKLYLPMASSHESETADFIVYKTYGKEMKVSESENFGTNLNVSMDITANNYARVYIIMDELSGDVIEAQGHGNIKMTVGTVEALTMNGRYEIERGNYNFSFQGLKRYFTLGQNASNYILWNGDPAQAILNINAEYKAENVKFNDLVTGLGLMSSDNNNLKDPNRYRGTVLVIAKITDRLTAPKIQFDIQLPEGKSTENDPELQAAIALIRRDENEVNKQVSFLVLFNSFAPVTASKQGTVGNTVFEGLVINSISSFLSTMLTKEFSSIFQNVFNDQSLRITINASLYNASSTINPTDPTEASTFAIPDRTNLTLSVNKSYMNERLTFMLGSAFDFGLTAAQSQAAFQFLPDVSVEYKLTPDGKFRLTFFYRDNYSYIAGKAKNRSGVSFSYRKEFNKVKEIFNRTRKVTAN
jgi:hypothetical protein